MVAGAQTACHQLKSTHKEKQKEEEEERGRR
jgi:hypothetical protein